MSNFRPYWFDQALKQEGEPQSIELTENITADICIIGGGYTGLWTALQIKEREPEKEVVVIEQKQCGYGASGCNGGCVLTLATKYLSLKKFYGEKEAKRLVLASEQAVDDIKEFTEQHHIDCDLRIDGSLYIATNESQIGVMDPVLSALDKESINSWKRQKLEEAKHFSGTDEIHEAFYSHKAGSVQPALLVRGLARVAREKGIKIFENTPMKKLIESHPPKVITPKGSVTATKVIVAINAWMASQFKSFERTIAVVSSDMAITKPIPKLLEKIKIDHGATICDSRIFVHYFHSTSDGRLMMGKGGNTFAFGSKMIPTFFKSSRYKEQIKKAMVRFYPELKDVEIEQSWTGGSDRTTTGFPFFGNLNNHPNIHYGFGYSGNGVTQAYLGGKILSSLALNETNEWSQCGFVSGPLGKFPPEPIRWLGAIAVRNAIRRKEAAEDKNRKVNKFDNYMARFAKAAGKADK